MFSAVAASTTNGPDIVYSDASITPGTMYTGSAVTATVTVTNTGGSQQDYNATLVVDGDVVVYETGQLTASETTTVSFTKTLWQTGARDVSVGGLASQTVTVDEANAKFHGGPANRGYYPNQTGPSTTPVEAWNISDGMPQVMQPTIVGDTLYTAFHDGGKLYALDPETGAEKWNATPGGGSGSTWTTPAYANGVLYLGTNDYKLHAIDATDGTEQWNYSTQTDVRSAPTVVDGVVYFGSNDGNMTALNATTGQELWHYTLYQPVLVESNPAVVDGVVYFGANDDNVTALNATTGEKIWNYTAIDAIQSDATVANDTVFIGSDSSHGETAGDGQLYAINATDGTKRWNYTVAGDLDASPVYADGVVYAGSRGGDLVALNAADGTKIWSVTRNGFRGAPVVAGDTLYLSDFGNGTVYAFNATDGTERWYYDSPTANLYPTPLAWNGYLYYGSGSHFYALEQPAPTISNVTATNPSGQDVQVTFDSDTLLSNISVSVSGAETATLEEGDFTESSDGGSYSYTATHPGHSDGEYIVTILTAADGDGADGANSESDSVTVDTVPPAAPSTPGLSAGSDTGRSSTDDVTSETKPTVTGTAEANAIITIRSDGDGTLGTTTADAGGAWSFTPSAALSEATHTLTATATDDAGNTGPESDGLDVVIDTSAPGTPSAPDLTAGSDTGGSDADNVTNEEKPTVTGTTEANATVTIRSDQVGTIGTTNADAGGAWSFTPDSALSETTHALTATATDAAGNSGPLSAITNVTVDVTSPVADGGSNRTVDEDTVIAFDGTNSTDTGELVAYEWAFGDGTNATGTTATHTFGDPGSYTVSLTVTDAAGNQQTASHLVTVTDTTPPTAVLGNASTVWVGTTVDFDATDSIDNSGIVDYEWAFGDGTSTTGATTSHTFGTAGTFVVTMNATDAAGNRGTAVRTLTVRSRPQEPDPSPPTDTSTDRETTVVVETGERGGNVSSNVSVTNTEAGVPVVLVFDDSGNATNGDQADGEHSPTNNVSVSQLAVNVTNSEDFTLNVTTYERSESSAREETFRRDTGATPAGYVVVDHSVSDDDIEDVTFQYRVQKRHLETSGLDPDTVALYRDEGTRWRYLDATPVDETSSHFVFESTSPGLSVFAIGSTVPVFDVRDETVSSSTATPGEHVDVRLSVANDGGVDGTYDAVVLANGDPVAAGPLDVEAFGETTATLPVAFDAPGTYDIAVDGSVIGAVTVEPDQEPESTPASGEDSNEDGGLTPEIGLVIGALVCLAGLLYAYRRRTRD
ncbi:PQQ-binding-like beta-propeller repeat protein [Natrinema sp. H-ect4]